MELKKITAKIRNMQMKGIHDNNKTTSLKKKDKNKSGNNSSDSSASDSELDESILLELKKRLG
jgi:hypothetical protein